jgi:HAD superfamily hydrolase (TIGR01509 family)
LTVRAVVLDLDGTIADSVDLFYGFACDVAADLDLPIPEREAVLEVIRSGRSTLAGLIPDSIPRERVTAAFSARGSEWLRKYFAETEPIPGSIDALRTLKESGRILAIATSSGRDVPFLERWGIRGWFAAIVGREDVERRKPAPDVLLQCLARIRHVAEDAIYVGDSPIDIVAGKAAGMRTVGVLSGASPQAVLAAERPDAILSGIADLPALLHSWS